jgi:hypothetical protein
MIYEDESSNSGHSESKRSKRSSRESLEAAKILYYDLPSIDIKQPLCLNAHKVARNQLAHGSELIGKFLMARGKLILRTISIGS